MSDQIARKERFSPTSLKIASPCPADWSEMEGTAKKRLCAECKLHVYNFSEMSQNEIEDLLGSSAGRVCAKLRLRTDGTVILKDCPIGLKIKRRVKFFAFILISILSFGFISFRDSQAESSIVKLGVTLESCVSKTAELPIVSDIIWMYRSWMGETDVMGEMVNYP